MSEQVNLNKKVFDKTKFRETVNTAFSELSSSPTQAVFDINLATVSDFFILYDKLFYEIPKEGITNSHEYLINTSLEYTQLEIKNEEVQILLDEIVSLREEILKLQIDNINLLTK
jgi:hypothetical protein